MSSYLLLRNNKESGPFTIEEIQSMSLKAYDLIWVVGKSAAWRYPGEIQDLKSFAPAVPEQLTDMYARKPDAKNSDSNSITFQESSRIKFSEPVPSRTRENNGQKVNAHSVYVHLPADKKPMTRHQDRVLFDPEIPAAANPDPVYDFSNLYKKRTSTISRFSGRILWPSTVILLFGTGILTGFFISDRRKFFSTAEKTTHKRDLVQSANPGGTKEISTPDNLKDKKETQEANTVPFKDTARMASQLHSRPANAQKKKSNKTVADKKDSLLNIPDVNSSVPLADSPAKSSLPITDMIYQQIKAHPENYISLQAGRYSTGMFGGISSFPITLTNNSRVVLELVVVSIDYIQNNEKIFKTESLSFNDLEPGESVTLKAPKSPRGVKISTHMHVLNSGQLDAGSSN